MSNFWQTKPLDQLTKEEWESLCDGCGWCCLHKLEDIDTGEVVYTTVACRLLNLHRCRCTEYNRRSELVPTCIQLNPEVIPQLTWLPETCAYRRLSEGKDLPEWHYLRSGNDYLVHRLGVSIRKKAISERDIDMSRLEDFAVEEL